MLGGGSVFNSGTYNMDNFRLNCMLYIFPQHYAMDYCTPSLAQATPRIEDREGLVTPILLHACVSPGFLGVYCLS